jgi:predicted oxidoreductase
MVKIKVTSKTLMVNLEFPIEVGQVKLDAVCQAFISQDQDTGELDGDFDFIDYNNVTYMGMSISDYGGVKKLKAFHNELGINLDALINNEYNKVMTSDFQKVFISTIDKKLFSL